jgi:hypothetical protein
MRTISPVFPRCSTETPVRLFDDLAERAVTAASTVLAYLRNIINTLNDNVTDLLKALLGSSPVGTYLTHAPRNNTVEVFPSCPRMDRCYKAHAR